ncbi:MAG: 2-oxo acid dehydrogenase subunit E2, partial [Solirubrobacteraceae bacterium]|nr:2-oxo acid dehydrogenase subunit E2 [Solirubrobacteraceae bacterium]
MAEIVMPRLSDSMEEGTIVRWLKRDGDEVARGEELVEIETDKATMAYESDTAGMLQITAPEGATLAVGAKIAVIGDDGSAASAAAAPVSEVETVEPVATPVAEPEPPALEPSSGERVKASPIARRIAGETGVDLHSVSGSGPGGRIVKVDVEGASRGALSAAASSTSGDEASGRGSVTSTEPSRTQALIARRMAESRATVPSFTLQISVDMTTATTLRAELKATAAEGQAVPTINDMVVKAAALALREQPQANGAWRDGKFEHYSRINIGVAVAGPGTLVVPTVFDADSKTLAEIAAETGELAERVRSGTITPPQTSGGTFTVSNLGMFGVRSFEAVINTPQAAILAVGAVEQRPAVHDGEIEPRMLM